MPGLGTAVAVGIDTEVVSGEVVPEFALLNDDGSPILNDDGDYILTQ